MYFYSFICLSAGAVERVLLLCYHSIAPCTSKFDLSISDTTLLHHAPPNESIKINLQRLQID